MASLSPLPSCFFRYIESSGWNSTYPTAICHRSRSVSSLRRDWNLRSHWLLKRDANSQRIARRSRLEAFASTHGSQSADTSPDDLRAVYRDPSGRWALPLGLDRICHRRLQRWARWSAGSHASSADSARTISGPDCRQASLEHDVSGALDPPQDSLEVYGRGFQPRHFDSRGQRGFVRHCRAAELPPEHFREGQHSFTNRGGIFRAAASGASAAVGLDRAHRFSACHFSLYDCLSLALRDSRAAASA